MVDRKIGVKGIRVMGQREFGDVAYGVMERAFAVQNELGRFFEEKVYQRELAFQLGDRARIEVPLRVAHGDFCKTYFLDLVVDCGALFELKAVERLADVHRSQLLNYTKRPSPTSSVALTSSATRSTSSIKTDR